MTTRRYEHQRGSQAQEGQTKAVRPASWAHTLVTIWVRGAGPEAMATSSLFTEGKPPDGRTLPPRKDVNPESEMTTRGYEHQRGLQAQEGHKRRP